ncbi:hypothetical protein HK098_001418 [Nowakowskiella sp. JEL0407]|nr:hypothetical protein HK098_001418 [Nowakowskiella sp. JEL0407]
MNNRLREILPAPFGDWFLEIPPITRTYVSAVVFVTVLCHLNVVAPIHLHYNWVLIWKHKQYWRLVTTFLYFGPLSLDLFFHMFFLFKYSRMLEESSFRNRTADFFWLLFLGAISMLIISPLVANVVSYFAKSSLSSIAFLSSSLSFMMVYIWSRRNPTIRMNFLGLFNFRAPYLPWVLLGFTVLLNNVWPTGDLLGMFCGHVYYFFEDVYPNIPVRVPGQRRTHIFQTPTILKMLMDSANRDPTDASWVDDGPLEAAEVVNEETVAEGDNSAVLEQQPNEIHKQEPEFSATSVENEGESTIRQRAGYDMSRAEEETDL